MIDVNDGRLGGPGVLVLDQDLRPRLLLRIVTIEPLDQQVLFLLAVVAQNVAAVQLAADLPALPRLGNAEARQRLGERHVRLAQLDAPRVGLTGIADGLLTWPLRGPRPANAERRPWHESR